MEAVGAGCWGRICATLIAKLLNYLLHSLKLHWVCFSGKVLSMVLKYAACKTRSHDGKSVRWTDRWVYLHFKSTLLQILWKISLLFFFFFPRMCLFYHNKFLISVTVCISLNACWTAWWLPPHSSLVRS